MGELIDRIDAQAKSSGPHRRFRLLVFAHADDLGGLAALLEVLARAVVVDVHRELLGEITDEDVAREGFPAWAAWRFIEFFCTSFGVTQQTVVTRIEFAYLNDEELEP